MKILHDYESYVIVLDNGEESELTDIGEVAVVVDDDSKQCFAAFLQAPETGNQDYSAPDGMEPVVYLLTPQPTDVQESDFDDGDDSEYDSDDDPEDDPERSEPRAI